MLLAVIIPVILIISTWTLVQFDFCSILPILQVHLLIKSLVILSLKLPPKTVLNTIQPILNRR